MSYLIIIKGRLSKSIDVLSIFLINYLETHPEYLMVGHVISVSILYLVLTCKLII